MRSHLLLALNAVALLGTATAPAFATTNRATSPTRTDTNSSTRPIMRAPVPFDSARVRSLLSRAEEASFAGRIGEARRLYREVIDAHRESNQPAGMVLWRLATTNLYADDKQAAASNLDEMAEVSARFGDPVSELKATFEAAILYSQIKRGDLVAARMERVNCLLQSPVISDEEKARVRERIKE